MRRLFCCALALGLLCGCGVPTVETPSSGPVFTDWSKLEAYQPPENLYTRYYEDYTDSLIPIVGGYGSKLLPFEGATISVEWGWSEYLYGLATRDGVVVCDPVYQSVQTPTYHDYATDRLVELESYLLLSRPHSKGTDDGDGESQLVYAVAAADGSWVLEGDYLSASAMSDGRLFLMDIDERFWFCDETGILEPSPLSINLTEQFGGQQLEIGRFQDGLACLYAYEEEKSVCWLLNAVTGLAVPLADVGYCSGWYDGDRWTPATTTQNLTGYLDQEGNWAIEPQFDWTSSFQGDYAQATLPSGEQVFIDRTGTVALTLQGDYLYQRRGADGEFLYWDCSFADNPTDRNDTQWLVHAIYDQKLQRVDHPAVGLSLDKLYDVPAVWDEGIWTLYDGADTWQIKTEAQYSGYADGRATFCDEDGSYGIYDCTAGKWIIPLGEYTYLSSNSHGGQTIYWAVPLGGSGNINHLMDGDGNFLAQVGSIVSVQDGLIRVRDEFSSGWIDLKGNWLFRWIFPLGPE